MVSGMPTFTFTNPTDGSTVTAQRNVPGVDAQNAGANTITHPNLAYGADPSKQRLLGFDNLNGDGLTTDTNGLQNEGFDQQAGTSEMTWQANDNTTLKYIFGYSSFFYDRNTDVDLTSSQVFDRQFYVSQEAEYTSHELQAFNDVSDKFSLTSGLFYYDSKITQRGDFYDSLCQLNQPCTSRYANPAFGTAPRAIPYAAVLGGFGRSSISCRSRRCTRLKIRQAGDERRSTALSSAVYPGAVRGRQLGLLLGPVGRRHKQPRPPSEPVRVCDEPAVPDPIRAEFVRGVYARRLHLQ